MESCIGGLCGPVTLNQLRGIIEGGVHMLFFVQLFLTHHKRTEEVSIDVPTPQRLSQMSNSNSPYSSPVRQRSCYGGPLLMCLLPL